MFTVSKQIHLKIIIHYILSYWHNFINFCFLIEIDEMIRKWIQLRAHTFGEDTVWWVPPSGTVLWLNPPLISDSKPYKLENKMSPSILTYSHNFSFLNTCLRQSMPYIYVYQEMGHASLELPILMSL